MCCQAPLAGARARIHCILNYPTASHNANLNMINSLKKEFVKIKIGYSDHTIGNFAIYTAVSLGATVIEKHFTLNKKFKGTDHVLSADLKDLIEIRKNIDIIQTLLGKEKKLPTKKFLLEGIA